MTGHLREKKDHYYVVLNVRDEYGKRQQKWVSTGLTVKGNKRKAEAILNKLIAEYDGMGTTYSKDMFFTDYMFFWLDTIAGSIEPNTYESYRSVIKRYIVPYFSKRRIKLHDLEPLHLQEFYNGQLSKISPNTVIKQHANIRKALQYAVKMKMIPNNPADMVTLPKKNVYHAGFYTAEQVNNLLVVFKDEPIYPAVLLTAFYGFRRSEVLGLKWPHIDFEADTITVRDTVVQHDTVIDKPRTKTKASQRTLPLIPAMRDFLIGIRRRQSESKIFLGPAYIDNEYICKRDNGEPFIPDYITGRFLRVLRKNNLPHIRFHDLRHSAASMLLSQGFSLKEIQEWLGHGTLATTANIYAHLEFKAKKDMAVSLGKKLVIG